MIVSLSLSVRVAVNAEALNMAESVGNYSRHRKAPMVIDSGDGYSVIYVPAVSGEALAHAYQVILAQIARERKLPVTEMDSLGYLLKFSDKNVLQWYPELTKVAGVQPDGLADWVAKAEIKDIEKAMVKTSVVADVGGFLFTDRQIKRTSAIRFSYMLPVLDAVERGGAALVPQLHVRYAPPELRREQALIYIESGSALYTFSSELVATDISRLYYGGEPDDELSKQRLSRVEAAIDALIALVDGMLFGAKRSRYMPVWEVRSTVVALSKGPVEFIVSPGVTRGYIRRTYERALMLTKAIKEEEISIFAYNDENLEEPRVSQESRSVTYKRTGSHTEALVEAKEELLKMLSELYGAKK